MRGPNSRSQAFPEEPIWVNGDRTRLSQILSNLLSNSAKFTESGGQVAIDVLPLPERRVTVTVRDTGIGIEPELLPRIFDPFAQADHSLDHPRGGLGLGLALVRGWWSCTAARSTPKAPGRDAAHLHLPTSAGRNAP